MTLENAMEKWSGSETKVQKERLGSTNWHKNPEDSLVRRGSGRRRQNLKKDGTAVSRSPTDASSAVVEQFITLGATQAWLQLTFTWGELSRVCGVQRQLAPATPVHVSGRGGGGEENEEEQRQRTASRQMGQPTPGGRNQDFQLVLFWILLGSRGLMVKATKVRLQFTERQTIPQQIWHPS